MYYARCGHELKDNVRFCPQCGSPVDLISEENVSDTDEIMHAEQEQEENASAQLQNEPASFSTVMDETKTRSKRRIPIAVIVALVLALAVGAAFAGYYIYTTYAASQQEEQTDTDTESEEPPEEQSEANPEYDEAMAAYTDVLDEYRAFMEFVNDGGDVQSLELNPDKDAWANYPYVAMMSYLDYQTIASQYQYAYYDFDGNGVPELVVGYFNSDTNEAKPIQMFEYYGNEAHEIFQSVERDNWSFYPNGYIGEWTNSGADTYGFSVFVLENDDLQLVESISLTYESGEDRLNEDSPYRVTHETADGIDEFTTTYAEAQEMSNALEESYSSDGEEIALDWQDL